MATLPSSRTFSDVQHCDTRHEHLIRLITDGQAAYAYGIESGATDSPLVSRSGATVEVGCQQPTVSDEPCTGHAAFDLTESDRWSMNTEDRRLLTAYGAQVDA